MLSQPRTTSSLKMCVVVFCAVLLGTAKGAHAQTIDCDGGLDPVSEPQTVQTDPIPENCFGGGTPGPNDCTDDGCMIDLLVVYTADARDGAGGTAFIEILIAEAVDSINGAFTNSQIDTYVRLAGTALVVYQETGSPGDDLENLQTPYDGFMDEALDLRDDLHADAVMLIVDSYSGGYARISVRNGLGHPQAAFGVVGRSLAAVQGKWHFAHEFGHIIGCRHHVLDEPLDGAFPYCHAYTNCVGASFSTLVANQGCGPRVLFYSNPEIEYEGFPMGVPINQQCPDPPLVSECPAHNAQCINITAPIVAQYRISDCNENGLCDLSELANGTSNDCNGDGLLDECGGGFPDCNNNGIHDLCDIACGTGWCNVPGCGQSPNCDQNCKPDECSSGDCNNNGIIDTCDIANGTSADCLGNWIPDECLAEAQGLGVDCNSNGINDLCDIDCGAPGGYCDVPGCGQSNDCGIFCHPDECDILYGYLSDCNGNGIADVCTFDNGCCYDSACSAPTAICDPATNTCVECLDDSACGSPNPYCRVTDNTCVECFTDPNCASGQVCVSEQCVECRDDSDCTVPVKFLCRTSDHTCVICLSDADCGANSCCTVSGTCSTFACAEF